MRNVILLGASGQLGQAISQQLNTKGITFQGYTRSQVDITNAQQLARLFKQSSPSIVINCAAYTAVDLAETEQSLCSAINQHAVSELAKLCHQYNTLLIHFSTDYVFDGTKNNCYTEQDTPNPINHYGRSKLAGEQAILKSGCNYYIVRTSWLYGNFGNNFKTKILQRATQEKSISVVNDQFGTPTHSEELAKAALKLAHFFTTQNALPIGIYHFSDGIIMSWYQLAIAILAQEHMPCVVTPITASSYKSLAKRPTNTALNSTKLKQLLEIHATAR